MIDVLIDFLCKYRLYWCAIWMLVTIMFWDLWFVLCALGVDYTPHFISNFQIINGSTKGSLTNMFVWFRQRFIIYTNEILLIYILHIFLVKIFILCEIVLFLTREVYNIVLSLDVRGSDWWADHIPSIGVSSKSSKLEDLKWGVIAALWGQWAVQIWGRGLCSLIRPHWVTRLMKRTGLKPYRDHCSL